MMKYKIFCSSLKEKIPGGTPLAKVIGREGMANIAAAATEPPAAATAGVASPMASKTSATVSAKVSSSSSWQMIEKISLNEANKQFTNSSQLVLSAGHLKRCGQNQASISTNDFTLQ